MNKTNVDQLMQHLNQVRNNTNYIIGIHGLPTARSYRGREVIYTTHEHENGNVYIRCAYADEETLLFIMEVSHTWPGMTGCVDHTPYTTLFEPTEAAWSMIVNNGRVRRVDEVRKNHTLPTWKPKNDGRFGKFLKVPVRERPLGRGMLDHVSFLCPNGWMLVDIPVPLPYRTKSYPNERMLEAGLHIFRIDENLELRWPEGDRRLEGVSSIGTRKGSVRHTDSFLERL